MSGPTIPNEYAARCRRCQRPNKKKRRGLCGKCYNAGRTRFLYPEYKRGRKPRED